LIISDHARAFVTGNGISLVTDRRLRICARAKVSVQPQVSSTSPMTEPTALIQNDAVTFGVLLAVFGYTLGMWAA